MKKALIFASYIPSKDKVYIGLEFLDFFKEFYHDYDLYVGVNPSCQEWIDVLENNQIKYDITPEHLIVKSDVSAYQTALKLLKKSNQKYDLYTFAHTKGVTSNAHTFRREVFERFLGKKIQIEKLFENNQEIGLYSPWVTTCSTKNSIQKSLDVFLGESKCKNTDTMTQYTFYTIRGCIVNNFIDSVKDIFWECKITDISYPYYKYKILGNQILWDFNSEIGSSEFKNDIYFFERDFPMIAERECYKVTNKLN